MDAYEKNMLVDFAKLTKSELQCELHCHIYLYYLPYFQKSPLSEEFVEALINLPNFPPEEFKNAAALKDFLPKHLKNIYDVLE